MRFIQDADSSFILDKILRNKKGAEPVGKNVYSLCCVTVSEFSVAALIYQEMPLAAKQNEKSVKRPILCIFPADV